MARKLKDIDVAEISLVDSAANQEKFFIIKRSKLMDWIETLKKFLGEDELSEEDIAKAEGMPDDEVTAIQKDLDVLSNYDDGMPDDVLTAIRDLAKRASLKGSDGKEELTDEEFIEEVIEKAGARFSKATIEQLKKIKDAVEKLLKDQEDLEKDKFGKLPPDVVKKLKRAEDLEKAEKERLIKEKEDSDKAKEKEISDLKKRLEKLEKKKRVRKGIEGQESDDDDKGETGDVDDDGPKWPSLTSPEEED